MIMERICKLLSSFASTSPQIGHFLTNILYFVLENLPKRNNIHLQGETNCAGLYYIFFKLSFSVSIFKCNYDKNIFYILHTAVKKYTAIASFGGR